MAVDDEDIQDTDRDLKNTVACKVLTTKNINEEYFSTMMPRIWGIEGYVKIEKAGRNIYQCKFTTHRDKCRITSNGPWSFDDAIIIFKELRGNYN